MKTEIDFEGKPIVRVCSTCQKINTPGMEKYGLGVDEKIKSEMDEVNKKIISNFKNINFSHGLCNKHLYQMYENVPNMTPERLASVKEKLKHNNPIPCLLENEPLRHAYMKGLFTQEQIEQAVQNNQPKISFKDRIKKLAGIKNS